MAHCDDDWLVMELNNDGEFVIGVCGDSVLSSLCAGEPVSLGPVTCERFSGRFLYHACEPRIWEKGGAVAFFCYLHLMEAAVVGQVYTVGFFVHFIVRILLWYEELMNSMSICVHLSAVDV